MPVKIHDHVTDKPFACWACEYATVQRMWQKAIRDLADTVEALEEAQLRAVTFERWFKAAVKHHNDLIVERDEAQGKQAKHQDELDEWSEDCANLEARIADLEAALAAELTNR